MKNIILALFLAVFSTACYANTQVPANLVTSSTSAFAHCLTISDTNVQQALNDIDACFASASALAWGNITGTLSNQSDLQAALNGKYSTSNPSSYISNITGLLSQGTNVTITGSGTVASPYVVSSSGGGSYSFLSSSGINWTALQNISSANAGVNWNNLTMSNVGDISIGSTLTAFGDSVTYGSGNTPNSNGYVYQFAAAKGWTITNTALGGNTCEDTIAQVMAVSPTSSSIYSYLDGLNDMRYIGTNAAQQEDYRKCIAGSIGWLGVPTTQKIYGQSASKTGTWTNSSKFGGSIGIQTVVAGSTATFTTTPGKTVYVYALAQNPNSSTFSVTIDGVLISSGLSESAAYASNNGGTYATALWRFPGLTLNPHTVVITATAPDATNAFTVLGAAAVSDFTSTKSGPLLYIGSLLRMPAAGYGTVGCSPIQCLNGSDLAVGQMDALIDKTVADMQNDGLNVNLIDVTNTQAYDPNSGTQTTGDNIHPNNLGHANIAKAFISQSTALLLPKNRMVGGQAALLNSNNTFTGANSFSGNVNFNGSVSYNGVSSYAVPMNVGVSGPLSSNSAITAANGANTQIVAQGNGGSSTVVTSNTVNNAPFIIGTSGANSFYGAQKFVISSPTVITGASVYFYPSYGTPTGQIQYTIQTDNSGAPSGTLANANATVNITPVASNTWNSVGFTQFTLSSGTYWLVIAPTVGQSASNYWLIGSATSSGYPYTMSYNQNGSWIVNTGYALSFYVYNATAAAVNPCFVWANGSSVLSSICTNSLTGNMTITNNGVTVASMNGSGVMTPTGINWADITNIDPTANINWADVAGFTPGACLTATSTGINWNTCSSGGSGYWSLSGSTVTPTSSAYSVNVPGTNALYFGNDTLSHINNSATTAGDIVVSTNSSGNYSASGTYTATTSGSNTILTFTGGSGSFSPAFTGTIKVLVVAGGGGAATVSAGGYGGGGGAGGVISNTAYSVTAGTPVAITVGAGGAPQFNGGNSVLGSLTAIGGGASVNLVAASSGGSGGGGGYGFAAGGAGTAGQGYAGGTGNSGTGYGGGGGGCGGVGSNYSGTSGGNGGPGCSNSITGSSVYYGGGGGAYGPGGNGSGGLGGGGNGGNVGTSGTANTGGGAGGSNASGGATGGSGVVIISFVTSTPATSSVETARATQAGNWLVGTATTALSGAGNIEAKNTIKADAAFAAGSPVTGVATLSSGAVTVSTVAVTTSSSIILAYKVKNAVALGSLYVSAVTAGTSFTITSTGTTDNSTVSWLLIN